MGSNIAQFRFNVSAFCTGPIGLVCLLVAKAMGASKVVITGNTHSL